MRHVEATKMPQDQIAQGGSSLASQTLSKKIAQVSVCMDALVNNEMRMLDELLRKTLDQFIARCKPPPDESIAVRSLACSLSFEVSICGRVDVLLDDYNAQVLLRPEHDINFRDLERILMTTLALRNEVQVLTEEAERMREAFKQIRDGKT